MIPRYHLGAAIVGAVALLTGAGSPTAQERTPRFEPGNGLIATITLVPIDSGYLIAAESRERPNGPTVRPPVAIFRGAPRPDVPPLVMLHGGPGANGLRSQFPQQAAAWATALERDVIVYDQRGAGLAQPALCPEVIE